MTYDATGNPTTEDYLCYTHDARSQLRKVSVREDLDQPCDEALVLASYDYDANGQRVHKQTLGVKDEYYVRDLAGRLVAEYVKLPGQTNAGVLHEYVWLGGRVLSMVVAGEVKKSEPEDGGGTCAVVTPELSTLGLAGPPGPPRARGAKPAVAGIQTVRVDLEAYLDITLNMNFFFDTFRLEGTVCQ